MEQHEKSSFDVSNDQTTPETSTKPDQQQTTDPQSTTTTESTTESSPQPQTKEQEELQNQELISKILQENEQDEYDEETEAMKEEDEHEKMVQQSILDSIINSNKEVKLNLTEHTQETTASQNDQQADQQKSQVNQSTESNQLDFDSHLEPQNLTEADQEEEQKQLLGQEEVDQELHEYKATEEAQKSQKQSIGDFSKRAGTFFQKMKKQMKEEFDRNVYTKEELMERERNKLSPRTRERLDQIERQEQEDAKLAKAIHESEMQKIKPPPKKTTPAPASQDNTVIDLRDQLKQNSCSHVFSHQSADQKGQKWRETTFNYLKPKKRNPKFFGTLIMTEGLKTHQEVRTDRQQEIMMGNAKQRQSNKYYSLSQTNQSNTETGQEQSRDQNQYEDEERQSLINR